jgi:hypothetical protein
MSPKLIDGVLCDYSFPVMAFDSATARAPVIAADREIDLEADEAPGVPMHAAFPHWDRLR